MKSSLNHIYRSIWSEALNAWVAVSELTSAKGKRSGSSVLNSVTREGGINASILANRKKIRLKPIALALAYCFTLNAAQANPIGAQVVNGTAAINQSGNTLTVTNSPNAIINWQGFSINTGETTRFNQQSASSTVLNRVLGADPSQLLGTLTSNGKVFLINPAGILVGQGARIDVAGFVASTLNISNSDFLAGKLNFTSSNSPLPLGEGLGERVINQGTITTPEGGTVYLVAPQVENNGIITTPKGETILAAGNTVQLMDTGTPGVTVQVTGTDNSATNLGQILADSGRIGMVGAMVNNSGTISASSLVSEGGRVFLKATNRVEAGGTISAQGVDGGEIKVLADMQNGTVDVTGTLDVSVLFPPSGSGGGGNGGFIETSAAHVQVADTAHITTAVPNGKSGTWLIDPVDFTIAATGGNMTGATLSTNLGGGNISILSSLGTAGTAGDVNVNDVVTWSANKLTLNAQNNININANLNGSGTAQLALEYGQQAVAAGNLSDYIVNAAVNLPAGNNFSTKLGSDGVAKNFTVITALGTAGSATTTDLQGMNGNLSANYALGSNIDASATSIWNAGAGFEPMGNGATTYFNGAFDGLGHTIASLTINRPGSTCGGMFCENGGTIANVGLTGGRVSGTNYVGGLVGSNFGTITNSYSTGSVTGAGGSVGGLVGYNYFATITNSYSTGSVTGVGLSVGGLVGHNSRGAISNSYSTGSVSGTDYVGGLVGSGYNSDGAISNSYSTGRVSGTNYVGGLVGYNGGAITNSYSTGAVSGTTNIGGLAGFNFGPITNSYWDTQTSGQPTSAGGTGLTTAQMQTASNFTGFVFTSTPGATGNNWVMVDANGTLNNAAGATGATFPMLASEYSTTINNAHQLQLMQMAAGASYTLGSNIDASNTNTATTLKDIWSTTGGFVPVGNATTQFTGTFDGLGHTITGLTINRPTTDYVGMFGYTGTGSAIRNVGLVGCSVNGASYVGELAGYNASTISNSYTTGSVSGIGGSGRVGGMVGWNDNTISNSYATGNVSTTGLYQVGGLVGMNWNGGTISNSYATGSVTGNTVNGVGGLVGDNRGTVSNSYATGRVVSGTAYVGGLLGYNLGAVTNSFWNTTTSGQATSAGGTGLTTTQMMTQASFSGWDFTNTWGIQEGVTYPYLKAIAANVPAGGSPWVISGNAAAGTVDVIGNGVLLGTATVTNGSFSLSLPGTAVTNGEALVVAEAGTSGTLLFATSNNLSLGLLTNTLLTNAVSSLSDFVTAKGALVDANIPYITSGANVATNTGVGFVSNAGFTLNGNLQATGITLNGLVTLAGNHTLDSRTGDLSLAGGASGAYNLTLNSGGAVTQGAAIHVAGLELLGAGGNYQLTDPGNMISILAGNTGTVNLTNSAAFSSIGMVNGSTGLTASGGIAIGITSIETH